MTNTELSNNIINTFDGIKTKYNNEFIEKILQENGVVIPRINYKLDFTFNQTDTTTIGVDTPKKDMIIQNALSLVYIKSNLSEVIELVSNELMNTFKSFKVSESLNNNLELFYVDMKVNNGNTIDINDYLGVYLRSKEGINLEGIAKSLSRDIIMNIVAGNIKTLFLEKIKYLAADYRKTEKNASEIHDLIEGIRDETHFINANANIISYENIFADMDYNDLIQIEAAYEKFSDESKDKEILDAISKNITIKQQLFNNKLNSNIKQNNKK